LASGIEHAGFAFDSGPYVLLDRPGLEWAFHELGLSLEEHVPLERLDHVYQVATPHAPTVHFYCSLERTAAELDRQWPGSGRRYRDFVARTEAVYRRLQPLQRRSRPGAGDLLRSGAWRGIPFLLRSLGSLLDGTGLPAPVQEAAGIWTHIAGQKLREAPSPLAFVPSLIHGPGAFYPPAGIRAVPETLAAAARRAGVEIHFGVRVRAIRCADGRVQGVETDDGSVLDAGAVVANAHGVGTYLTLLGETPPRARRRLAKLPLQSPGICVYLALRGPTRPPYLRFWLPGGGALCRLLVTPSAVAPGEPRDGWHAARLIAPMDHSAAEEGGVAAQSAFLEQVLAEPWWQEHAGEHRVLATRLPAEWGRRFHLHRDSMNPVMTARFMRQGRLAHRSPYVRGLYLAGSSTHPGQWVSFCAISGILAADCLLADRNA
jgi:phytoene dehydrogenase-like protein